MKNNYSGFNKPALKPNTAGKKVVPPKNGILDGVDFFKAAETVFKRLGYDCYIEPKGNNNEVEYLIISAGEKESNFDDLQGVELQNFKKNYLKEHTMIQLMFLNDMFIAPDDHKPDQSFMLQFFTAFPLKFKVEKFWKVNNLLLVLNRIMPIGALGIDKEQKIYFRYTYVSRDRQPDLLVVVEIIELIRYFTNISRKKIIAFVEGSETLQSITDAVDNGTLFQAG